MTAIIGCCLTGCSSPQLWPSLISHDYNRSDIYEEFSLNSDMVGSASFRPNSFNLSKCLSPVFRTMFSDMTAAAISRSASGIDTPSFFRFRYRLQ